MITQRGPATLCIRSQQITGLEGNSYSLQLLSNTFQKRPISRHSQFKGVQPNLCVWLKTPNSYIHEVWSFWRYISELTFENVIKLTFYESSLLIKWLHEINMSVEIKYLLLYNQAHLLATLIITFESWPKRIFLERSSSHVRAAIFSDAYGNIFNAYSYASLSTRKEELSPFHTEKPIWILIFFFIWTWGGRLISEYVLPIFGVSRIPLTI